MEADGHSAVTEVRREFVVVVPTVAAVLVGAAVGADPAQFGDLEFAGAEAVAASVALARRLGLETQTVVDALGGGPLVSLWQAAKLQRITKGDFSPQFALSLALKDVHLALEAADDDQLVALGSLAGEWQRVVDQGLGDQDVTVVTRALEQRGGAR